MSIQTIQKIALIGTLSLIFAATLSAQSALLNPQDDNCWSSLNALRACQTRAYDQAQSYAQRCTSYPEYQCFDYYQPPQKTAAKSSAKATEHSVNSTPSDTASPVVTSGTSNQASDANR